jgi:serine/threonine protein phosphatase PrpC
VPVPETPAFQASAGTPCPCGEGRADGDGYCDSCGKRVPAASDHAEIDLSPAGALVSDRGLKHPRNEDSGQMLAGTAGSVTVAIADGVSTSDHPQAAATAAARAAVGALAAADIADDDALIRCVQAAQDAVAAVTDPALLDRDGAPLPTASVPACTLVAARLDNGDQLSVVSVGDSRAYWIPDNGAAEQLTVDDSWAAEQIAAGAEPGVTYADKRAHAITAWLGTDAGRITPHPHRRRLDERGVVLLCSDGLWNYATDIEEMTVLVRAHVSASGGSPLAAARTLTEFAQAAGGDDNITVAILYTDVPASRRMSP